MLTGDENIVDINFTVFWLIKDAQAYLFNIRNPEATVKAAAESAMREVVGETPIAPALAEGRGKIEAKRRSCCSASSIPMAPASSDAGADGEGRSAGPGDRRVPRRAARARRPRTAAQRGGSLSQRHPAAGARRGRLQISRRPTPIGPRSSPGRRATPTAFCRSITRIKQSEDVTLQRLYLETMEEILKNSKKIIIDKSAQGNTGVLPYLPLPELCNPLRATHRRRPLSSRRLPVAGSPIPPVSGSASSAGRRR